MQHAWVAVRVAVCLSACTFLVSCAPTVSALGSSITLLLPKKSEEPVANHNLRYLRVAVDGRTITLVLGYVDDDPEGRVEVWYSAQGEVLKLQNGRIVGTAGLATDWPSVRLLSMPSWRDISSEPVRYVRLRDEMPGYRMDIRDDLSVRKIAPSLPSGLIVGHPEFLQWYEERTESTSAPAALPPSRFAVGRVQGVERVVYAEQCLAKSLCLAWQRWPVTIEAGY